VVVAPDVQHAHKQDTERYILTNLNIVGHAAERTERTAACVVLIWEQHGI
jgi:hypothetical protein